MCLESVDHEITVRVIDIGWALQGVKMHPARGGNWKMVEVGLRQSESIIDAESYCTSLFMPSSRNSLQKDEDGEEVQQIA